MIVLMSQNTKRRTRALGIFLLVSLTAATALAQSTSVVSGTVRDTQGGLLPGATVTLSQPSSGLRRVTTTSLEGRFEFTNLPVGNYQLQFVLAGFVPVRRVVDLSSGLPVALDDVTLALAALTDVVDVRPDTPLVDATSAGTRHAVSITRIDRLPVAVSSRGLESVLVAFPGFSQNANGAIHPRGAHNQMTFMVDGLPISDQLTGAFANSLDVGVVQTAEVLTGNVPAEFGSKVSGVAILNSRSGLGTGGPIAGSLSATVGGFGTWQGSVQAGGELGSRVGYFASVTGMRTNRFLDQVSLDNLHNGGQFTRFFSRVDVRLKNGAALRLHAMGGRSAFDLANLRSQQQNGQDQRQALADLSTWATYQRTLDTQATIESTVGFRTTTAALTPSAGDTPVTAAQDRRLSTYTGTVRYTRVLGRHLLRAGVDLQHFPVDEFFTMGITSSSFNEPGSDGYNAGLAPYDLTRGGGLFTFRDARAGTQAGAFVQTTLQIASASIVLGLRHDEYHFLVSGRQLQPRVGVAWRVPGRDVVLRASYNRTYQTPPNENLLLSNSEEASQLAPESVREALGGAWKPIQPERQNVYEVGAQAAVGRFATVDLSVYQKDSVDQQDNNNFFDTGIIFPTTLQRIHVIGAEARLSMLSRRGVSGSVSVTTGRAISTPPFTGGLFLGQDAVDLLSAGPFAIDHDQRLGIHGTISYDAPGPWWAASSIRYDGGLVANPSDPAEVAADPDFADLLPYVDLLSDPARVRPRTIVDLGVGVDLRDGRGVRRWGAQLQVTNVTNRVALYNFQSVFVGTRLVQPRTVSLRLSRHF
jgi:hypothetical protein